MRDRDHLPDMQKIVQDERRRELHDAKRAWSEASREFRETREDYDGSLACFLKRREEGKVIGSKTDFDAAFFVARSESNNKLALAQAQFARAKKVAQGVGVLPIEHQTSDFADQSDDGYTSAQVETYVRTLDRSVIERWRRADGQKDVELDQEKWEVEGAGQDVRRADSVAAESSCSQDRYNTGRLKKLIARWRNHQAELRTGTKLP